MRELVKYRNSMNSVAFSGFNHKDYNIFYSIVSRMRDKQTRSITFSYRYLMKLSGLRYGNRLSRFTRDLNDTYTKMTQLGIKYHNTHHIGKWLLFTGFDIDTDKHTVTIKVNPDLVDVLNNLVSNFTRFSLMRFTSIRSPYCQALYRLIEQFRTTGYLYLPMEKFRRLLDVPKSYNADLITRHVLYPIKIELTPLIKGLHVVTVRRGRGGKAVGYKFTFTPQSPHADYVPRSKEKDMNMMIRNITGNNFLSPKMKDKSAKRLLKRQHHRQHNQRHRGKREPMKVFNRVLKQSSLDDLKVLLDLHKHHSPTVNFSEYQVRKLKRAIRNKSK